MLLYGSEDFPFVLMRGEAFSLSEKLKQPYAGRNLTEKSGYSITVYAKHEETLNTHLVFCAING